MDLREYEQSKFAIAEILRAISVFTSEQQTELRQRLRDLFARLAEDRFNLVVVGRFNRGKTSLLNALLVTDRLPTGIVPLTSVITTMTYGSKERVVLKYRYNRLDGEIPIEALAEYVTQQGNPGNVQRIATAEIHLPAEILRRGFYFVDTPGLGSVIAENTLTTEEFLPEADAFVLVTSYESPLSEEELRFFKAAAASGKRIFVAVNKHDTVSIDQRNTVLGFVREQLNAFLGRDTPQIFSVSSTDGLDAKLSRNETKLDASGIAELETQLIAFLVTEKSSEFLVRMCDRVREFLNALPRSIETENLIEKIGGLVQKFDVANRAMPPATAASFDDFANPRQLPTCEICKQIADKLWECLCKYQYEIIVNDEQRERFADRGGLCPFHAWQLQSVASPYGACVGYPPLLDRLAACFRNFASQAHPKDLSTRIKTLLPGEQECAVCNVRDEAEQRSIAATAGRLRELGEQAMQSLSAVCVPHFVMLAAAVQDDDLVRSMLKRHAAILQRHAEDMRRYAVKHDAARRYLASQEEQTVAERSVLLVTGRKEVNFLPRNSDQAAGSQR